MGLKIKRISGSLLLRSFYLISIPIVLIQLIGIIIFFELHWDLVLKKISNNIVNNIEIFVDNYDYQEEIPCNILDTLELKIIKNTDLKKYKKSNNFFLNKRMKQALKQLEYPSNFRVYNKNYFIILINKNNKPFNFLVSKDRVETKTIPGFFLWILFCSIILSLISYYFIKNQIRPLKRLGIITRSFGRGIETPDIRPTGSSEIRGLIRDFNNMKNNVLETINSQTTMLAGISHDLKTPLTRISLMTEGLENQKIKNDILSNITEMDTLIISYVDFIKNEKSEISIQKNSSDFIRETLENYKNIHINKNDSKILNLKKTQISRVIKNVIENALKFSNNTYIDSFFLDKDWLIVIQDDGPGTELNYSDLIKPFVKGKNNMNQGSGLGLSIVNKITILNNGKISFNKSKFGGLEVRIRFNNFLK